MTHRNESTPDAAAQLATALTQRDAALAAFAHLAPRIMHAAETDDLESASLLLSLRRGLDWLEYAGLSFEDAKQARVRVVESAMEVAA